MGQQSPDAKIWFKKIIRKVFRPLSHEHTFTKNHNKNNKSNLEIYNQYNPYLHCQLTFLMVPLCFSSFSVDFWQRCQGNSTEKGSLLNNWYIHMGRRKQMNFDPASHHTQKWFWVRITDLYIKVKTWYIRFHKNFKLLLIKDFIKRPNC